MNTRPPFVLLASAAVVVGALVAPLFMAPDFEVERSVFIDAPASEAYGLVADLERHPEWHPWDITDSLPRVVFGETRQGAGASYFWIGARDNHGTLTFTRVDDRRREIDGVLELAALGASEISFRFAPSGGGVTVREIFRKDTGRNLFKRYLHPVYRSAAGEQLDANLARLKQAAEAAAARSERPTPDPDTETEETGAEAPEDPSAP